jgi:hypothetical protein
LLRIRSNLAIRLSLHSNLNLNLHSFGKLPQMHHTSLQKDGGMIRSNRPRRGNSLVIFPKRQGFALDDEKVSFSDLRYTNPEVKGQQIIKEHGRCCMRIFRTL